MSNTQWPLNKWIMDKVQKCLTKEGCSVSKLEPTPEGLKLSLTDSFGFIYELNIKTVSRVQSNYDEVNLYDTNAYTKMAK